MLSLDLLRTDPGLIRDTVRQRGLDADVDRLLETDEELRQAVARAGTARAALRRHAMSREPGDPAAMQTLKDQLAAANEEVRTLQEARDELWGRLPNLLAPDTPPGSDVELRRAGTPVAADESRRYATVAAALRLLGPGPEGTAAGGFPADCLTWRGAGAQLAWAVFTHAQRMLTARGCTPLLLPSGQALIDYPGDQIIDVAELPVRLCGFSPGIPAGSGDHHDQDRAQHGVRQLVLCREADSAHWLDECQRDVEDLLRDLELPYRVVRVGISALAPAAYQTYATECWFPGSGGYLPTHTNSYCTDYQARRFKIRYLERGRVAQPHTVSATTVTDRAVLAILENHLQPDGSVRIPDALHPYLDGQELIEP